ncbi:GNAT family N-acetyltransferase [Parvimonas micra]|uniref:Acetyltransferase, GNAT family n=1 Tax=Parvimonas micra ATCC 33270 TaxID=411465 RepID=A8SM42_9FIRM|nr:GNAT family N-acetyltransferase [Parvimonas micra]EDP23391.1 acetyltransferase, GNAT family [Parvimonas micra ATCC 33270]RSB90810.1 GNAT family N-acetyltransferase [Parvimonas micra]VEH97966.1 ribosomal-protein-alanine acetyltransferase [Parvimonas micra]
MKELIIKEIVDIKEKEKISREILNDLPEWFGMPESTEEYITDSQDKPFIACFMDKEAVGFVVLNATSVDCADIFVMGIKKNYHRMGIGTKLNDAYEELAKKLGYTYSQVKTVQSGHYKEYDITNNFYKSVGYKELEVFPTLWDEWNPCQIYIKYIGD